MTDFRQMIIELGQAIAAGDCTPEPIELRALLEVCERGGHVQEAARVRRWLLLAWARGTSHEQ